MTRPKLTAPQAALLKEMQESHTGGLFIDKWRRYWRTAEALEAKGYVRRESPGYSGPQVWFEPIPADTTNQEGTQCASK